MEADVYFDYARRFLMKEAEVTINGHALRKVQIITVKCILEGWISRASADLERFRKILSPETQINHASMIADAKSVLQMLLDEPPK